MATYAELRSIAGTAAGDDLRKKIEVAVAIKATALIDGTPTAGQLEWALDALTSPQSKSGAIMNYVLAVNKGFTVAQITGASDAGIQTNVDAAVDALVS